MLKANKNRWLEFLFGLYNKNLLRRRFHSILVDNLDSLFKNKPSVIYANHSSWWDGLIAFHISQRIKADSFIMMEEKQLRKLFLFRKLGAFSVVRENPRKAIESLNYAINLLKADQTRTLWIFPQGEILPSDIRPIKFYNGLSRIAQQIDNCIVTSIAIRYEFLGNYKPDIFVKIGSALKVNLTNNKNPKSLTEQFQGDLTQLLDSLSFDIATNNLNRYENIL